MSPPSVMKYRLIQHKAIQAEMKVFGNQSKYDGTLIGSQKTYSFRHHRWKWKIAHGINAGGYFATYKAGFESYGDVLVNVSPDGFTNRWAKGHACPRYYDVTLGEGSYVSPSSQNVLLAIGANLMASALPTNPLSGLARFLGELRDPLSVPFKRFWPYARNWAKRIPKWLKKDKVFLLRKATHARSHPSTWEEKARKFRDLAKNGSQEYLGHEFGWKPFLKDIADFAAATKYCERALRQFERDSGKTVRRTRSGKTDKTVSSSVGGSTVYGAPTFQTWAYSQGSKLHTEVALERKRWFVGGFTYYLPPSDGPLRSQIRRREMLMNHIYGTRVTASTLWDLAPWSWALDWIGNNGKVIKNLSAFQNDGLVLRYGYVMETTVSKTSYSLPDLKFRDGTRMLKPQVIKAVTKVRYAATPYGFGLNEGSFSARQLAIIAALGINRT